MIYPTRDLWRFVIIALGVLILCSCQAPMRSRKAPATADGQAAALPPAASDPSQAAVMQPGQPGQACPPCADGAACPLGPPGMELGVPMPYCPRGPWHPPGIEACDWPSDEYVCDGGNQGPPIQATKQGEIRGLHMEDTVAKFDTLDGRTLVEPSNKVCLYSPRFGAVRQVVDARVDAQLNRASGVFEPTKVLVPRTSDQVGLNVQRTRPIDEKGDHPAELLRMKQGFGVVSSELGPRTFDNGFKAFENLAIIRQGVEIGSETAFLAKGVNAAVSWNSKQEVQIMLDHQAASAATATEKLQETYTVTAEPGHPKLRIIKVASTPFAEPGDEVSFTLRFDNVGNQPIGNVAILDSLSTRLEYVPGSAQCSLKAKFSTQANEGGSVVVRCELADPLKPTRGGVLRFRCVVR